MIRKTDQRIAAVSMLEKKLRVHSYKTKQDCIIIAIVIIIIILIIVIITVLSSLSISLSFLRYEKARVKRVILEKDIPTP